MNKISKEQLKVMVQTKFVIMTKSFTLKIVK